MRHTEWGRGSENKAEIEQWKLSDKEKRVWELLSVEEKEKTEEIKCERVEWKEKTKGRDRHKHIKVILEDIEQEM